MTKDRVMNKELPERRRMDRKKKGSTVDEPNVLVSGRTVPNPPRNWVR